MPEFIAHQRKSDNKQQSVEEHLLNVSKLTKEFSSKAGLPLAGKVIGFLHDFGKYSREFQQYIHSAIGNMDPDCEEYVDIKGKKGKIDHSTAGAQVIHSINKDVREFLVLRQILSLCIVSHHGGLIDCLATDGTDAYTKRLEKTDEKTHCQEATKKCNSDLLEHVQHILESEEIIYEIESILKLSLEKETSKTVCTFYFGMIARFLFSCLLDADRTDTADFENPENKELRHKAQYPGWDKFIVALETRLSMFTTENHVDELRSDISEACKKAGVREQGIFTLTVPTGGGKTLASLRFALEHARRHNLDRVIYVIPYTSIIDQNANEVSQIFADLSQENGLDIVLEHHSNLTPEKETTAQKLMAENWDVPIVFTTSVQLLDSLFKGGTRSARRMHNLAKAVIVFDEIQTLPVKTVHIFNNAMNFLTKICGSSVVLCTATQPLLHKVDASKGAIKLSENSEIMPNVSELFDKLKRVEVIDKRQGAGLTDEQIAELVKEELACTGSVLCIVNTKKSAKNLYELCKELDADVYHLSTNQCPQHRLEVIEKIRKLAKADSGKAVVCISTQLIEAGVNVDFGSVIRYIAGLDSIAQAAGRCNRDGKRKIQGRVLLVNPRNENIGSLYDITMGKIVAERIFQEFKNNPESFSNDLLGIEAMKQFFEYYFYGRKSEMEYPVTHTINDTLLSMLSMNKEVWKIHKKSKLELRQSFSTAGKFFKVIESSTQGMIVPYGEGNEIITELFASLDIIKEKKLLKLAQRYTVNLYENTLIKLQSSEAIVQIQESGLFCLEKEYYSKEYGVSLDELYENYDSSMYCC